MRSIYLVKTWVLLLCLGLMSACENKQNLSTYEVSSPSENVKVNFFLTENNIPAYQLFFHNQMVLDTSMLGFDLKDQTALNDNFEVVKVERDFLSEDWELPWGEQRKVENKFNELTISLKETGADSRLMNLVFRVYNDGIGFRYDFPEQPGFKEAVILEENTQFKLVGNHESWWMPGDWDSYEHLYNHTLISEIDAMALGDPGLNQSTIMENAVHTPFTMKSKDDVYISIHEANLTDYSGMTLLVDTSSLVLQSGLVKSEKLGYSVKRSVPFHTPWRTIQLASKPGDLIASKLILNLNEPNILGDVSWVKPMKYNGIWWEMHLEMSSWAMESENHGATTANAKKYIDFAAANNLGGVLVEGWNTGWDRWTGIPDREGVFDFVTPYADYDLNEVVRYAKDKGVTIIMHHETSAAPRTYEKQLDAAYGLMQSLGLHDAKLGYVGRIIPEGEHHHGQWMVNHYRNVLETAAKYKVAINVHEPIKPTGLRRTYPNLVSAEGVRGQEFNAWASDGGNPPDHLTIVPFTRMLAGPIDYTPGIFNIKMDPYRPNNQVNTTLAQQLALYVIIYSPVQMAADLPKNYDGHPAFQFIRDVGVDWDQTEVLDAEIGDYVTIARKERGTGNWFLGSITDENAREVTIDFGFLDDGKDYVATIYKDGKNAHWDKNPTDYAIETLSVNKSTQYDVRIAPGGGVAISIIAQTSSDL